MKHLGDICKIHNAPNVWIVCGGSPCQDLSVAGLRKGLKHSDKGDEETTRSGLFMEQIRVTKEMRENDRRNGRTGKLIRPRFFIWENVPGALSSGSPAGEDFRIVLEEVARIAEPVVSRYGHPKSKNFRLRSRSTTSPRKEKTMSVDLWAWRPSCDDEGCCGDCDLCKKAEGEEDEQTDA